MDPAPREGDPTRKRAVTRPRPGHADLAGLLKYDRDDARDALERASARETTGGPDVSRQGVQRDLVPIVEGSKRNHDKLNRSQHRFERLFTVLCVCVTVSCRVRQFRSFCSKPRLYNTLCHVERRYLIRSSLDTLRYSLRSRRSGTSH